MKKYLLFSIIGLAVFAFATTASAVGSNGSFENGISPGVFTTLTAPNNTSITDWTVDTGSIDYIGSY